MGNFKKINNYFRHFLEIMIRNAKKLLSEIPQTERDCLRDPEQLQLDPFRKKFLRMITKLKTGLMTGVRLKQILNGGEFIKEIIEVSEEKNEEQTQDKIFLPETERPFLMGVYKKILKEIAERYIKDADQDLKTFMKGHRLIKKQYRNIEQRLAGDMGHLSSGENNLLLRTKPIRKRRKKN